MRRGRSIVRTKPVSVRHTVEAGTESCQVMHGLLATAPSVEPVSASAERHVPPCTGGQRFRTATAPDCVRLKRARQTIAETPPANLTVISARVPPGFDTYLATYVARHNALELDRRRHISKQDAVAEARGLFYATDPLPPDTGET